MSQNHSLMQRPQLVPWALTSDTLRRIRRLAGARVMNFELEAQTFLQLIPLLLICSLMARDLRRRLQAGVISWRSFQSDSQKPQAFPSNDIPEPLASVSHAAYLIQWHQLNHCGVSALGDGLKRWSQHGTLVAEISVATGISRRISFTEKQRRRSGIAGGVESR